MTVRMIRHTFFIIRRERKRNMPDTSSQFWIEQTLHIKAVDNGWSVRLQCAFACQDSRSLIAQNIRNAALKAFSLYYFPIIGQLIDDVLYLVK